MRILDTAEMSTHQLNMTVLMNFKLSHIQPFYGSRSGACHYCGLVMRYLNSDILFRKPEAISHSVAWSPQMTK